MSKNTINPKALLPRCLLLLWTLTAFVSGQDTKSTDIQVTSMSDGIKVVCPTGQKVFNSDNEEAPEKIEYKDENTGKYFCKASADDTGKTIFVKFRTCDNCVDLNVASVSGMIIGDIVATAVIGVAVYLLASQTLQTRSVPSNKKKRTTTTPVIHSDGLYSYRSDRQHLVANDMSSRSVNDHYQPLKHGKGKRETYDVLNRR